MIPKTSINVDMTLTDTLGPTRTYKTIDNKIQGFFDELNALKQSIYKVLNTEKYEYPIYGFSYGIELENLIGKDRIYVQIELKRRINECLIQDERVKSVDNFQFVNINNEMLCTFNVRSIYGDLTIQKGVNI